ncbi:MAG: hypothetical protein F4087_05325 [Gemmatimonadetes bacterium]|nr:hypothetical protein [Gemmatimonadota bacterium]MYE71582.1 hypothetical protein [Gemmatimonadota bacterium]MYJ67922.1 hypothetical protein [Gemmatimonadota bacterium]
MTTPYSDPELEAMVADLESEFVERKESLGKAPPGKDGPIERILNERRRHRDTPFDLRPLYRATLSDLHIRRFEEDYLSGALDPETLAANDRSTEEGGAPGRRADDPVRRRPRSHRGRSAGARP